MTSECISIVGTGYVGLVTAVGFASRGYKVITSTHDSEKVALINKGVAPFFEAGLEELLRKVVREGYLKCVLDCGEAVLDTDITFIAVGTPSQQDGSIDLQYIRRSAREIGEALRRKEGYHLVVVKSTVVPGTTVNMVRPIIEEYSGKRCGVDFGLCMSPEFLREGSALFDTLHPDRIIIGEWDKKSGDVFESLCVGFYREDLPPVIRTNPSTAEVVKYANNAFLATKISFINTIANICERIPGVDVTTVAKGIGLDQRINSRFLRAGLGYGGSCFPKDVKALIAFSKVLGYDSVLLNAVEDVNNVQPYRAVELLRELVCSLEGKQIAILGLAFKPGTDDMREAVSIKVVNKLLKEGARVIVYDPFSMEKAREIFGDRVTYASTATECLTDAEGCIVVTEWDEFRSLSVEDFVKYMKEPNVVDGRRIYDPRRFGEGVRFRAVGLGV
ncbi:UDP-glucose 6-dehydrogenase [Candidatus Bathyarchaeota archaeon]|nr:MAG: UDP-glucose 6-dehydrogenase [Candidatus Bathyarchaeota archaeon]